MHVDDNALTAFVAGVLPAIEQSRIRDHLDDCEDCRAVIAHAAAGQRYSRADTLAVGSEPQASRASQRRLLEDGASVGPYVIERLVGVGGMGVVYAARDPRLDRLVALKLIRHQRGLDREQIAERMRRESKALARLSHANVTAVYELGTAGDEIFVAMEYVAGATLRAWLLAAPRSRDEILATFVHAGRGLAAAHAAGLVHRDFKPDNVLIGDDGVVKVTDFGLARLASEVAARGEDAAALAPASVELTATGAVVGTPAYMAPEQFTGTGVDARADQFAFCVALYEALHGERPFRGATVEDLRAAVLAGRITAPRDRSVPPRVRRALERGLSVTPTDRFATVDDLLSALSPRRPTVALAVGGGALAATAAIAAVLLSQRGDGPVCKGASAEVETVWNAVRRAEMQRAFGPVGAETFTAVARGLDGYFAGWTKMHGEACEATRVHKQQSEAALDVRTACLGRQRAEVDALVGVLVRADASVVAHAREAIVQLPAVSACIAVDGRPAEAVDPALRARVDAARAQLTVANHREALPALDTIVAEPALAKLPALEAEVQQMRAKILGEQGKRADAEQALFRGLVRAQSVKAEALIASITVDLAHLVGFQAQRVPDGLRYVELATAAITARGGDDLLTVRLHTVRGAILQRAGKLAEAEAAQREALAIVRTKAPATSLEGEVHDALGMVLALQGKFAEALPELETSLTLTERTYGKQHSLTANVHANLANVLGALGRDDEARAHFETALAVNEAIHGADSVKVATVLSNLGQHLQERGKLADARKHLERALGIRERLLGPDDPAVARTAANLGYLLLDEKSYQAALDMFTRVGTILEAKIGADHPARGDDLAGAGMALIGLGKPERAIAPLRRAVALGEKSDGDPVNVASIRAGLGRALYASKQDRAGGVAMAKQARAILLEAGETRGVADIDAWLP